jgi:hypothetical protein
VTIQVPGRPNPTSNPLHVLNAHLGEITEVAKSIRDLMAAEGIATHHRAGVALKQDGTWGTFCIGCSAVNQDFIYPCLVSEMTTDWPPETLIAVPPSAESTGV